MIEVRSLQKTYRSHGAAVGLLGADFLVPDGQIVGILGENGAGKSTVAPGLLADYLGIDDFVNAILEKRDPVVTYDDALQTAAFLDASLASAHSGRVESLKSI